MSRALLIVLCLLSSGCDKLREVAKPAAPKAPAQESLLELVPDKALATLVLRSNAIQLVRRVLDDDPEMHKELREYLVQRVGLDLTGLSAVVAFVTSIAPPDGALFLRMPLSGQPKWQKVGEADGVALYRVDEGIFAAALPTGLILGTEGGVRTAIAVTQKKEAALKQGSRLAALLEADASCTALAAASLDIIPDPQLKPVRELYGISSATAGYSPSKIFLWASGDPARLATARDAAKGMLDLALANAKAERDKAATTENTFVGASAIVGYHQLRRMIPKVTPRLEGSRLIVDYAWPPNDDGMTTLMTGTAVVGILAAIAIPSFMKYVRRSKTVEATINLRRLSTALTAYVAEHRRLPPSADWAPGASCCDQPEGKCQPSPASFAGATWSALGFSIEEPHYFQYRITTSKSEVTIEARGDLDCDHEYSSFRRSATVGPGGTLQAGAEHSENELE
jgi:type IV pilus assembly protein PilA